MPATTARRRKHNEASAENGASGMQKSFQKTRQPSSGLVSPQRAIAGLAVLLLGLYFYYTSLMSESHMPPEPLLFGAGFNGARVADIPGKGKGVIATRDIAQGELLLRERPLLRVPNKVTNPGPFMLSTIASLSPTQRAAFYNLSYIHMPTGLTPSTTEHDQALALAIFQTNAVTAGSTSAGLFPTMARLNHGCAGAFNVVYSYRENEGVLVVYAMKPIKAGEEILTTYLDTKRPRAARQEYLRSAYAFDCTCSVCSLPPAESALSDARLSRMAALYERFSSWQHKRISGKEAVEIAREIWRVGEEEGYWSERGQLAADAALVSAAHGDEDAVRGWAALAETWYAYELGLDSEQAQSVRDIRASPHTHRMWGVREVEEVGPPGAL